MKCIYCNCTESRVVDSRPTEDGAIRRRRECEGCQRRFTTYEKIEMLPVFIIKKDKRREQFDPAKVRNGILKACEKRPVPIDEIEKLVNHVETSVCRKMEQEVTSEEIGQLIMEGLKDLDEVAYIRFASVYRQFKDVQSFMQELQQLLDTGSVGMYGLAYTFCNVLFTIFHSLNNTWVPFFFDDIKNGARDRVKTSAKTFLELFTVLAVGFVLLAPEVFRIYARRDFWDGTGLIPLFATGYYLNFLCTFPVNYEYSRKKTKAVAVITVSCSLVNLGLNYVMIQSLGMEGAALATTVSHSLQLLMHYVYTRYFLGKGDYPFGLRMWLGDLAGYLLAVGGVFLIQDAWLLRWAVGAALGVWELTRIRKRRSLL